ncbi:hypothetical protein [Jeotgalibacillus proteolyticus]|uniref:Uncharacterized protein n=1 Tax=Jeotgalibacillus proteolyticus TaxID=2082395 RepID=A0A2S5G9V7_9BACL|nr:hypothetical protein [Jeotgalibacillus proteolyticus]PPA69780.1 hypothetical protein C4B60_14685 [Jeotgalibacillus proteolyticus]
MKESQPKYSKRSSKGGSSIKALASHGYTIITRKIEWEEQHIIEHTHELQLFENRIVDHANQFPLAEILDISYKSSRQSYGLLYIHTIKGLFPYKVKEHPSAFIEKYLELK